MKVGIGLPTGIPGVRRSQVLDRARRADTAGFSALGTLAVTARGEGAVRKRLGYFRDAGVDEVVMFPASPEPEQVDLLAGVAL